MKQTLMFLLAGMLLTLGCAGHSDTVLRKIYHDNALRLLSSRRR